MPKIEQLPLPPQDSEIGSAAVGRYYQDIGVRLESLRLSLTNLTNNGMFVHALNVRWPKKAGDAHLIVVKVLHEEGPLIGFSSSYNFQEALFTLGGRLRSGSMAWQIDTYPPEGWEQELAWMRRNTYNLE